MKCIPHTLKFPSKLGCNWHGYHLIRLLYYQFFIKTRRSFACQNYLGRCSINIKQSHYTQLLFTQEILELFDTLVSIESDGDRINESGIYIVELQVFFCIIVTTYKIGQTEIKKMGNVFSQKDDEQEVSISFD